MAGAGMSFPLLAVQQGARPTRARRSVPRAGGKSACALGKSGATWRAAMWLDVNDVVVSPLRRAFAPTVFQLLFCHSCFRCFHRMDCASLLPRVCVPKRSRSLAAATATRQIASRRPSRSVPTREQPGEQSSVVAARLKGGRLRKRRGGPRCGRRHVIPSRRQWCSGSSRTCAQNPFLCPCRMRSTSVRGTAT